MHAKETKFGTVKWNARHIIKIQVEQLKRRIHTNDYKKFLCISIQRDNIGYVISVLIFTC